MPSVEPWNAGSHFPTPAGYTARWRSPNYLFDATAVGDGDITARRHREEFTKVVFFRHPDREGRDCRSNVNRQDTEKIGIIYAHEN